MEAAFAPELSADILAAAWRRVAPRVHRTPVLTSRTLDGLMGASLRGKAEHLQKTGSFKARGAINAVFALDEATAARGVLTHSSGNHGAALAWAARLRGIACTVVVPEGAPAVKLAAIKAYGATLVRCGPTLAAREAACADEAARRGATVVHPFNAWPTIAGQSTVMREFSAQAPDLDVVLVAVGGGGLLTGSLAALAGRARRPEVIGVEPAEADDAFRSWQTGIHQTAGNGTTCADGLRTYLGTKTFPLIRDHVTAIMTVSEEAIQEAMALLARHLKQVVEPSGAVPLAAVLTSPALFSGRRVGLILCGGNRELTSGDH